MSRSLDRLPVTHRRQVPITSTYHCPFVLCYTLATMTGTDGSEAVKWSETDNAGLSSDCFLQLENMESESLVIAGQHTAVNTVPGRVHTARHTTKVCNTRSR